MRFWPKIVLGTFLVCLTSRTVQAAGVQHSVLESVRHALNVPDNLAYITDAYWPHGQESPQFILIQDVHRHPQVQTQIAALIVHGYEHWGVRKVFLEGAFTALDLTVFHRVPNNARTLLMARLVKDGNLSGPEIAAVMIMEREWPNPPVSPFQLFGMEDPQLYRQNVQAYQSIMSQRGRALRELVSIRRLQDSMHLPQPNDLHAQLIRTEALLRLKLTPAEYQRYLEQRASVPSTPAIDPAVHAAEDFYRLVHQRSQMFLRQASSKVPAGTGPRILVVGGFHTTYMADLLRQEGRSFVVLSPRVSGDEDETVYEKRLSETASVFAQAPGPASQ